MNNEERNFLLDIYERFGDNAQAALDFVKRNEKRITKDIKNTSAQSDRVTNLGNGVYLIYENGNIVRPSEYSPDVKVKHIGIIHDGHSFAVTLKDLGRFKLVRNINDCPDKYDKYIRSECEALNDWDCVTRTRHIQEVGTDIPLKDGEYVPSLPMLVAMMYWHDRGLNDVLKQVGGEPISDAYYWSSTEYSATYAWNISGETGVVSSIYASDNKPNSHVVRAVCAWQP